MEVSTERRRIGVTQRSLGEQLDQWCEMLASASAAVSLAPKVTTVLGVGAPVHGLHVPRPPDAPRPIKPSIREAILQSHLTDLHLRNTDVNGKPPSGSKNINKGNSKKKNTKKNSANSSGKDEKKKGENNKSKSKGKIRTRSRMQTIQSKSSPCFTTHGQPTKKCIHDKINNVPVPSIKPNQRHFDAVLPTLQNSESESDCSDSDSECGALKTRTPPSSPVGILRPSLHRPSCKSMTNLAFDAGRINEISDIPPLHSPRKIALNGNFSKSTSNLTKLPEVISPRLPNQRNRPLASRSEEKLITQPQSINNTKSTKQECVAPPTEKVSSPVKTPEKKKRIKPSMISLVKPINQESEKIKFMQSRNYAYNPQFEYKNPIEHSSYKKQFKPEYKLIPLALKVLSNALHKHGTYEKYAMRSGGRQLTSEQIKELAFKYLKDEGLEDEVCVKLSPDLVSRACMTRVKGRPLLQVQTNNVHEGWMAGLLRHEIGTHYMRSCNNRCQVWRKKKKRRELDMEHQNPTEEGLASLHSVIFRDDPIMFRAAMLYYTVARGSDLSFSALFQDLQKFVKDPDVRWDYCVRAKRGFTDTSVPGAFAKDQVYLKGALEILKNRKVIDFHALLRLGKVSYLDVDRLIRHSTLENTRIPRFMVDLKHYHIKLNEILVKNGLTDDDLLKV